MALMGMVTQPQAAQLSQACNIVTEQWVQLSFLFTGLINDTSWTKVQHEFDQSPEMAYRNADKYCADIGKSLKAAHQKGVNLSYVLAYSKQWWVNRD